MEPAIGPIPASIQISYGFGWSLVTGASITGLSFTDILFAFGAMSSGGPWSSYGPVTNLVLNSVQFGSAGIILVVIALILGFIGMVAGFASRNNPRIGGVLAFLVIIALLLVGFTNLGMIDTSIGMIGIVPLLGIGLIGVGGVLGLAISEL